MRVAQLPSPHRQPRNDSHKKIQKWNDSHKKKKKKMQVNQISSNIMFESKYPEKFSYTGMNNFVQKCYKATLHDGKL